VHQTRTFKNYKRFYILLLLYITEIATIVFGTLHLFVLQNGNPIIGTVLYSLFFLNTFLLYLTYHNRYINEVGIFTIFLFYAYFTFNLFVNEVNIVKGMWFLLPALAASLIYNKIGLITSMIYSLIVEVYAYLEGYYAINTVTFFNIIGIYITIFIFLYGYEIKSKGEISKIIDNDKLIEEEVQRRVNEIMLKNINIIKEDTNE
jgi:hypothetical protein